MKYRLDGTHGLTVNTQTNTHTDWSTETTKKRSFWSLTVLAERAAGERLLRCRLEQFAYSISDAMSRVPHRANLGQLFALDICNHPADATHTDT